MDRIEQLAKRVGLSRTTVSRDLKWLSGESKGAQRKYFRVVPNLNEPALDLETVDVFLEAPDLRTIEKLENLCDEHPYTKYRARCYGSNSGLFVQFRIPSSTEGMVETLLKKLKANRLTTDFKILPTQGVNPIFSVTKLQHWNSESFTWDFDWKKWSSRKPRKALAIDDRQTPIVNLLDIRDISIITQLMYGARRKHKTIIEALKKRGIHITSQDFSRHLALLNKKFILGYMVFLDTDAFDLYSNIILTANCEPEFAEQLAKRMASNPIPFQSTLKIKDDFILWFLRLPPSHLSLILSYLSREVKNLNVSLLDYLTSEVYGVWSGAFNEKERKWIRDRKFLVTDPLESVQN
jgi:DNA-binding Lrp family transcriptional regulator